MQRIFCAKLIARAGSDVSVCIADAASRLTSFKLAFLGSLPRRSR
jgi:hypothetical protein